MATPSKNQRVEEAAELFRLGGPLVFTFLCDISFATVTTIATSWISPAAVAAVGLTINFLFFTIAFFFLSLSAITVITAELAGSGDQAKIGALLKSGFKLALIFCLSAATLISLLWWSLPLMPLSEEGASLAQHFLGICAWIVPLECFAFVFVFASNGLGKTFWVGAINFCAVPILIALTWVLAFGNLGFDAQGVPGVAYAILITVAIRSCAFLFLWLQKEFRGLKFLEGTTEAGTNDIWKILKIGTPLGLTEISAMASIAVIGVFVSQFGVYSLAAHNIAHNVFLLAHLLIYGLSRATVIQVGLRVGQGASRSAIKSLISTAFFVALLIGCSAAILIFAFAAEIAALYSQDTNVVTTLTSLLVFVAILRLLDDCTMILQASLEGLQRTKAIFQIRTTSHWFVGLASGYALSFWLGLFGFWVGIGLSFIYAGCLFGVRLQSELKLLNGPN